MSDPTIFGNESNSSTQTNVQQQAQNTNSSNPLETLLAGIKNESGAQKYASVEEALKALQHSQAYIPTLKNESEEAKRQAEEATRRAEEYQRQLKKQEELERTIAELTQKFASQENKTNSSALTPEQIAEMVNNTLTQNAAASQAKQNQTEVVNTLKAKFGDKAEEVYLQAAQELGMSVAEMNTLAAKSPKAVLKALGVSGQAAKQHSPAPFQSAVNTAGFTPSQDTFVKRNDKKLEVGATFYDMQQETANAKKMVEELHNQGLEISDLTNPKTFFQYFK